MARITSKWPRLLVTGDPVTVEQAEEILLRTNGFAFIGNDRIFELGIARALGIEPVGDRFDAMPYESLRQWYAAIGGLDLNYLENSRIYSSWIGGPHGWCDWDGTIGCSNYNLGKWPAVAEIEDDLRQIAGAWAYLRMKIQFVEEEGAGDLCGMWVLAEGRVTEVEPGEVMDVSEIDAGAVLRIFTDAAREQGVSLARLARISARLTGRDHG